MSNGKGSKRRKVDKRFCTENQFDNNYEKIFGKKDFRNFQKDITPKKKYEWGRK